MVPLAKRKQGGFTLIELVMVIVIIGVLSAIIVPNFLDYVGRSEAATTKANLAVLRNAIQTFRSENSGSWPAADLSNLAPTYIAVIPADGEEESNDVVNAQDGLGGWHWDTTSHVLKPNLDDADAYGKNYVDY
ncbi:MAG: type II secretion system protein [Planctomycetota bacterium]